MFEELEMQVECLSGDYACRILTADDCPVILELYESNPLYFQHYPPKPSLRSVKEDMKRLPAGQSDSAKFYVGFWQDKNLLAVLDFVLGYPDKQTVFIGLFMVHQVYQRTGLGSQIIAGVLAYFSRNFEKVRLAYVKSNPQAQHFWQKQGFQPTGPEVEEGDNRLIIAEKQL